ncbi:MAG: hypothetical protein IKG47_12410 [Oscillospiraceae bacterium]|nr:hypothetical protein [Oscillospiraceae bacterium]
MIYRMYIYSIVKNISPPVNVALINKAILENYHFDPLEASCFGMAEFDADKVRKQITEDLGAKCKVRIGPAPFKGYESIKLINITTSYERVKEVLPQLCSISLKNGLVLLDAETGRYFYCDPIDEENIVFRTRMRDFRNAVLKDMNPVWKYREVASKINEREKTVYYSVTLKKDLSMSFPKRVKQFYECLQRTLLESEALICMNKSLIVSGKGYSFTYTLEGYMKSANMIGFYDNGFPEQDLIRRMGIEPAMKWVEQNATAEETEDIYSRMFFGEMVRKFPNPSDRFVHAVRITKWQRKQSLGVCYGGLGKYGAEILFHVVPEFEEEADSISVLKIDEDAASFILPFVKDIYPYIYKRYHSDKNHLPIEMWSEIVGHIKMAKYLILHDTFCPKLLKYISYFNLHVFANHLDNDYWKAGDGYRIKNDPAGFIFDHRFEIALLYETFIQWSETQIEMYRNDDYGTDRMFNIMGP